MVECDVVASYLEITHAANGIKCPKCGAAYFLEKTVVEKVAKAEQQFEAK